jgi:hypothetical protein
MAKNSKRTCPDCNSSEFVAFGTDKGDGVCGTCEGTGRVYQWLDSFLEVFTYSHLIQERLTGDEGEYGYPCPACFNEEDDTSDGQCKTCGGNGFEYYNSDDTDDSSEIDNESDSNDASESSNDTDDYEYDNYEVEGASTSTNSSAETTNRSIYTTNSDYTLLKLLGGLAIGIFLFIALCNKYVNYIDKQDRAMGIYNNTNRARSTNSYSPPAQNQQPVQQITKPKPAPKRHPKNPFLDIGKEDFLIYKKDGKYIINYYGEEVGYFLSTYSVKLYNTEEPLSLYRQSYGFVKYDVPVYDGPNKNKIMYHLQQYQVIDFPMMQPGWINNRTPLVDINNWKWQGYIDPDSYEVIKVEEYNQ